MRGVASERQCVSRIVSRKAPAGELRQYISSGAGSSQILFATNRSCPAGDQNYAKSMQPVLIRCPNTKVLVQHLVESSPEPSNAKNEFEPFQCPACRRIHLINKAGKLLGDETS